jgi:neutral ceramidase
MLAGVAAADFTPEPGLILQGHLSKNPSHTVLYPLEARAIVLGDGHKSVCIVTLDVIGIELAMTRRVRARIAEQCGIEPDQILIAASHTHCAPAMLHNLAMTPDPKWLRRVEDAAVTCAVDAAKELKPVTLGLGCGSAHFNVNRRPMPGQTQFSLNWGGVVDHRARVLRIDDAGGRPMAVLFSFSCHPTTKVGSEGFISPDYPGVARRQIESRLKCRSLFLAGCFGNIRPQINGTFASATKEQLDAVGQELADAVCAAAKSVRTGAVDELAAREIPLTLPFGAPKSNDELETMMKDTSTPGLAVRADWARRTQARIRSGDMPTELTSVMQMFRIGPLTLVTIPGEPVQEIGYAIERTLANRDGRGEVWPLGYCNDQIGYLVTERHKDEGGYEPNAYTFYDRPAPYKDEEKVIVETAAKLAAG